MEKSTPVPGQRLGGLHPSHAPQFEAVAGQPADRFPTMPIRPTCVPPDHDGPVFQPRWEPPVPPLAQFASIPPWRLASPLDTGFEAPHSKPAPPPDPTHPGRTLLPMFPANPSLAKSCSTQEAPRPPRAQSPQPPAFQQCEPILRAVASRSTLPLSEIAVAISRRPTTPAVG